MSKVTIIQVLYNHRRFIEPVFSAIFQQTFKDFQVVAVISGNQDGGKEFLMQKFPQVTIIDLGYNIGFAKGHNLVFEKYDSDFFQLVNPDLVLEPTYVENMLQAFNDPKVGAATGKLYQTNFVQTSATTTVFTKESPSKIDTTGVVIAKSGRARDRGQYEIDHGQYDALTEVQAVSGAGPMYRKTALEAIKVALSTNSEFFDEDFHSYWEDVDLSWRLANAGWKNVFVPSAVGYHGRGAGSSEKGYSDVLGFIRHHKQLSPRVRELNYKNHIFLYLKNSKHLYPQFFFREFFMFCYILVFETATLKILPTFFQQLPRIWKKRKLV